MSLIISPCYINGEKKKGNFKNLSWAQFWKLRNVINGVGEFRYDIMSPKFRINRITGWEIVREDQTFTHIHTHTHTDTHTPRPIL